jgi:hypothetical protein
VRIKTVNNRTGIGHLKNGFVGLFDEKPFGPESMFSKCRIILTHFPNLGPRLGNEHTPVDSHSHT